MFRTTLKLVGLGLFIPSVLLIAIPLLATHSHLIDTLSPFQLNLGGAKLISVHHFDQYTEASSTPWFWASALAGEMALIYGQISGIAVERKRLLSLS